MTTAVLLCSDGVAEPDAPARPDADVRVVPHLCRAPDQISRHSDGASALVLGVCTGEYSLGPLQSQARKIGLDALGIELVDLRSAAGDAARLDLLVDAACARASAFRPGGPDNVKLSFPATTNRRALLTFTAPESLATPTVDDSRCAAGIGCRACLSACPRSAFSWSDGRVLHDNAACEPCGLCITACPTGAIVNPAVTPSQMTAEISALTNPAVGPPGPRGIAFRCRRSSRPETESGWLPVTVPCTGMLSAASLLAPLMLGAGAVSAHPCSHGGCVLGNDDLLAPHIAFCRELLAGLGLSPELVRPEPNRDPIQPALPVTLERPFEHDAAAEIVRSLSLAAGSERDVRIEHPASPLGRIEIFEQACTGCTMCASSCPTKALTAIRTAESVEIVFDTSICSACGNCIPKCPEAERGAIGLTKTTDVASLFREPVAIYRSETACCASCGTPIAPVAMLTRIGELLGTDHGSTKDLISRYCVDCRGRSSETGSHPAETTSTL